MDLKGQQRLSQLYSVFDTEVKQDVLNVITEYPDCDNDEIRKKIRANIENYFDKSIIILEEIKTSFIRHYETCRLPLVNSQTTLNKIALVEKEVDKKVKKMLKDEPRRLGFCHLYWATKQKILREHYGIIWHTPAECNPDVCYD